MQKLTLEQAIVISAYTGVLCCDFSQLHKDLELRLKRPVFIHELANEQLQEKIKELYKQDFLDLCLN